MEKRRSPVLSIRANGPLALFTRPELKTERVSYEVPTPSAVRGIYEAICWKPAIMWHVKRIYIFNEIAFTAFKRNEVTNKSSEPTRAMVTTGKRNISQGIYGIDVESKRAQRNTVALKNVDYQFEAFFTLTDKAGPKDNIYKFIDMFSRRVEKGQHFYQPYFGCRECSANICSGAEQPEKKTINETRELGIMLWDISFQTRESGRNIPHFFRAVMEQGILNIPENPIGFGEDRI